MNGKKYVLITAAKNEELFIEKTILSVINQSHKPVEWIIVSDGSTDKTESIVHRYVSDSSIIKLLVNDRNNGRDFASKVYAINIGLKNVQSSDYDFIGILDADVSFEKEYYSLLIKEFEKNTELGIAGGKYFDLVGGKKIPIYSSPYSIRGATQFFRKECFDEVGGIKPIRYGGEDALACNSARMYGWQIKNIDNLIVLHHRPTGLTENHIIRTRFRDGFVDYNLGYHPLFELVKCVSRFNERPYIFGSLIRLMGFCWANIKREKRIISNDLKNYIRREQWMRILNIFKFGSIKKNKSPLNGY